MPQRSKTSGLPVHDSRAGNLRSRYHRFFATAELPVPVASIATDLLGLHVEQAEIECSGLLLPTQRRIVLRTGEPPARQRFTLAHEIGHWICQVLEGQPEPVYCRVEDVTPGADRIREREANVFAAELLMPEQVVRAMFAEGPEIEQVAARFEVSVEAMQWRLYNFGLHAERPVGGS